MLIARVRSLARLKRMTDELRMRAVASHAVGIDSPERHAIAESGRNGHLLVVHDRASPNERLVTTLGNQHAIDIETDAIAALVRAAEGNYDVVIVSLALEMFDGLRLCSQNRSLERTRSVPILAIADHDNNSRLIRGLEIDVNDYLLRPVDQNELLACVRTQIRKKRYTERLRDDVQMSIEIALTHA